MNNTNQQLINAILKLGKITPIDIISILMGIATIIVSIIAIVYAIRVPVKIANLQNKISLYDKRIECLIFLEKIENFTNGIAMVTRDFTLPNGQQCDAVTFCINLMLGSEESHHAETILYAIKKMQTDAINIKKIEFLVLPNEKELVTDAYNSYCRFVGDLIYNNYLNETAKKDFIESISNVCKKGKDELQLKLKLDK